MKEEITDELILKLDKVKLFTITLNAVRLNELVLKSQYSHDEIAKALGITRMGLYRFRRGDQMKSSFIVAASTFFKVSVSYFYDNFDKSLSTPKVIERGGVFVLNN